MIPQPVEPANGCCTNQPCGHSDSKIPRSTRVSRVNRRTNHGTFQKQKYTWNPKQPFTNGCFNWMIPNLYIGNGCFTKHLFINGCLGFQVDMSRFFLNNYTPVNDHIAGWKMGAPD